VKAQQVDVPSWSCGQCGTVRPTKEIAEDCCTCDDCKGPATKGSYLCAVCALRRRLANADTLVQEWTAEKAKLEKQLEKLLEKTKPKRQRNSAKKGA
jgi:hypothetical protein